MSGGYFNYTQYQLLAISEGITNYLADNPDNYSDKTLMELAKCNNLLQKTFVYVRRIDMLLSWDDDEEIFHKKLREELL